MSAPLFTLGIEEEFQLIDPESRALESHVQEILADSEHDLAEQLKPELHQSVVEIGTRICGDIQEAKREVLRLRSELSQVARRAGLTIAAAGTHPFSRWSDQKITESLRYQELVEDLQQVARANLIFGLHVHVGVPDREMAVLIMNAARYFLPHVFALSTNSPFWEGRNTGLKSYRSKIFDRFPRTGIPDYFYSLAEYDNYLKVLIKTGCIDNGKKIWWDLRPHPVFGTLEFRVCDIATKVEECLALAAVMQALIVKFYRMFEQNTTFRVYRRALINENKWRAQRYGLEGKLIDFGKRTEVDAKALVHEIVELVDDVVDDLGSRKEVEYLLTMCEQGSSADRQLHVFKETNDLKAVVDNLIAETMEGVPMVDVGPQS